MPDFRSQDRMISDLEEAVNVASTLMAGNAYWRRIDGVYGRGEWAYSVVQEQTAGAYVEVTLLRRSGHGEPWDRTEHKETIWIQRVSEALRRMESLAATIRDEELAAGTGVSEEEGSRDAS